MRREFMKLMAGLAGLLGVAGCSSKLEREMHKFEVDQASLLRSVGGELARRGVLITSGDSNADSADFTTRPVTTTRLEKILVRLWSRPVSGVIVSGVNARWTAIEIVPVYQEIEGLPDATMSGQLTFDFGLVQTAARWEVWRLTDEPDSVPIPSGDAFYEDKP